jgi:ABC-2 type transport system permease protein
MRAALVVYRWELRKLVSQKRTYLGLGAAMAVPIIFVVALAVQKGQPNDVAFGRYVRESGLAIPLVLLLFGSIWLFPLITALVAGDIIASEHHNATLKTILTRSLDRGHVFAGKLATAVTYALLALVAMGTTAVVAGTIKSGFHPLVSLSGTRVSAPRSLGLVAASFGIYLLPLIAIAGFGLFLSAVTRNSAAAVVGTLMSALLMQLIGILPGLGGTRPYLLTTQFQGWQGFLRVPTDWAPIVRAAWLTAAYAVPAIVAAYLIFLRRDVDGDT